MQPDPPVASAGSEPCAGPELAARVLKSGDSKAKLPFVPTLVLGIMAGVYIGLGANLFTIVKTGNSLGFGMQQLVGGIAFCLGLILVVVGGAELFTGNSLIAMAWFSGRVSTPRLLRNWGIVYLGNFAGSLALVWLVAAAMQHTLAQGEVGVTAVNIAVAKCQLPFGVVLARGILCNALVCLAVWLCFSACSTTDKILAIIFPITAFVAGGFEHCVANMYFIPMGIAIKGMLGAAAPAGSEILTTSAFVVNNLIPATIGNMIGGSAVVGGMYWLAYLLPALSQSRRAQSCAVPPAEATSRPDTDERTEKPGGDDERWRPPSTSN